jgi:hypothetical protein
MKTAVVMVGALLVLAGTCASAAAQPAKWGPTWSEVSGERYSRVAKNAYPAIIKSIDGKHRTERVVKVEPGVHRVVVQSPNRKGFRGSDEAMEITFEPCVRYYINAEFETSVGAAWKPVLAQKERVPGCKLPAKP